MTHLVTGPWYLKDLNNGAVGFPKNGMKVFSCFHCGGGSTMGYKLAGFAVVGGVEIDPEMMKIYRQNFKPKYSYLMGVQDFLKDKSKIDPSLYDLDILDGSPPCSSFSMAGSREKAWGDEKKFREGQANQVLDDLFFHFINIGNELRPKVIVAENVKGLIMGAARGYVKEIFKAFDSAGYEAQLFLLNASRMGVPQARERTFFIARRKDLKLPKLVLNFNETPISVLSAFVGTNNDGKKLNEKVRGWWSNTKQGGLFSVCGAETGKMNRKLDATKPSWTITATPNAYHYNEPRHLSDSELIRVQSFPDDYDFIQTDVNYMCGMSVPPLMMQRVASEIAKILK